MKDKRELFKEYDKLYWKYAQFVLDPNFIITDDKQLPKLKQQMERLKKEIIGRTTKKGAK